MFEHALVVGKFYPPHAGHEYLIRTALRHCRRVTAAVLGSSLERLSMADRVSWLLGSLGEHPQLRVVAELDDVRIDYQDPAIWALHVEIMRRAIAQADTEHRHPAVPVDAVFSSEAYGAELARRFDAAHVCLDRARALYPVSGAAIRADIAGHWHWLSASVRAGLCARVVIVGAESTGTTTLTLDLMQALRARGGAWAATQSVPEYGREYSANLVAIARARQSELKPSDLDWQEADFIEIAREQTRLEERAARAGAPILLCDTDAFATCIWHERYRGQPSPRVNEVARALPVRALYILTSHLGVPFEDDGLRDGEAVRPGMTERFRQALSNQSVPWRLLEGSRSERCKEALRAIDEVFAVRFSFG